MNYLNFTFILCLLILSSCLKDDNPNGTIGTGQQNDWNLPVSEVLNGGVGKDGIPSLENPHLIDINTVHFLDDTDLVIGIKVGDEFRAYPHSVLDWHEIINDDFGTLKIAVTYCPLTGTGIGWDRVVDGDTTTFGVSGLLYNSNLMPYDRATDSNWSQMRLDCVNGELINVEANTIPMLETSWETWKTMFPDSKVASTNTGHDRDYDRYPYGDYKTSNSLLFPANPGDTRLHNKERVLGIIGTSTNRAYRFESFREPLTVVEDKLDGEEIVLFGSQTQNFLVAYKARLNDGTLLHFTALEGEGAVVTEDQEGNRWNVFGEAVSGPREGEKLITTKSFMGYWFSWGAFYPGLEIYEE